MQEEFSVWLSQELTARGWSQRELARRAGLSNQFISAVMNGNMNPGDKFIHNVAQAFGIPEIEVMQRAGRLYYTGPVIPAVGEINRRLLELDEPHRDAALKALEATLRAIETVAGNYDDPL